MMSVFDLVEKNPTIAVLATSALIAWISFKTQRFLTRAKNTIDFQASYHSKETQQIEKRVRKELSKWPKEEIKALAMPEKFSDELVSDIRETLNIWERAAIAVRNRVYDEDILYHAYGSVLIGLWKDLRPYTTTKQQKNPRLYVNFDWIAVRWMARRGNPKSEDEVKKLLKAQRILDQIKF